VANVVFRDETSLQQVSVNTNWELSWEVLEAVPMIRRRRGIHVGRWRFAQF
jgi:hypothetical protein